jgi:hypothetical protein
MQVFEIKYNDFGSAIVVAKNMQAAHIAFLEAHPTYNVKSITQTWAHQVIVPGAVYEWK